MHTHEGKSAAARAAIRLRARLAPLGLLCCLALLMPAGPAQADPDGHGPDAWQVLGLQEGQQLQARMGPGSEYLVIDRFDAGERGLQQVTCVPYLSLAHYMELSESQRQALPPRWCLMRSADLSRSGWVEGRFLAEDSAPIEPDAEPESQARSSSPASAGLQAMKARLQQLGDWMRDRLRANPEEQPAQPGRSQTA